jgi:2,4-dienoyl-CoA reductase (NADPH2)
MLRQLKMNKIMRTGRLLSTTTDNKFPNIFQPVTFGDITLKNRIIMGSMHTGLEESHLDELALFYKERAKGEVGLIVTGGICPNEQGLLYPGAAKMTTTSESNDHKIITSTVHESGGKIAMQILHAGRYAKFTRNSVAPSPIRAPINNETPRELSSKEIQQTVNDYARCAFLAQQAGYDGVEIMGSEGYLINQFLIERTNHRKDEWGGSFQNRIKFPIEIVKAVRKAVGKNFVIIYRLSMIDLVESGQNFEEIHELALQIKDAGASIINTGIGWHEARIPTIATSVPRATFAGLTKHLKEKVPDMYFCTSNRINTPEMIEKLIAEGYADFISMARPLLADPEFAVKAKENRSPEINTCIACNQACLDHVFEGRRASCLVNPFAGHEKDLILTPVPANLKQKIAVVGAGPSGLSCALTAAKRGHSVTLYERDTQLGGQFNFAKIIPGKEEFFETIRYFNVQLKKHGVEIKLNTEATMKELENYDSVVLSSGVHPRKIGIPVKPGAENKVKVYSYYDVLKNAVTNPLPMGKSIAVVGAGGIGYDISTFLLEERKPLSAALAPDFLDIKRIEHFFNDWGVDIDVKDKGGLKPAVKREFDRKVFLLQRKPKFGVTLGKTTGWIHRTSLKKKGVEEIGSVKYKEINENGLLIEVNGADRQLPVDTVIICAGQESNLDLLQPLKDLNKKVFLVGGSQLATELDAKRAIDQGTRLGANIENAKTGDIFNAPDDRVLDPKSPKYILVLAKHFTRVLFSRLTAPFK